jgi:hypothetical protein
MIPSSDRRGGSDGSPETGIDQRPLLGRRGPPEWVVGLSGFAIGATLVLRLLIPAGMDPTIFVAFGRDSPDQTEYARALIGAVEVRPGGGHDGKYFFVQANDPWFLDPERNAAVLDVPLYRGERMLFPLLAGGFGAFPPAVIVWSLLVTNVAALALGAGIAARLASFWGGSTWLGLSVPLNLGLLYEIMIDGSGVVAYACCLAAVYALVREKTWAAALLFSAAALSREVMLAFAVGVFVLWWLDRRTLRWPIVIAPSLALGIWAAYLMWRLDGVPGTGTELTFVAPPFVGLLQAIGSWVRSPDQLVLDAAILLLIAAFVPLAIRSRLPLAWGALPFVALATILSVDVFLEASDLSRALVPVFTAAPFVLFLPRRDERTRLAGDRS